MPEGSLRSLFTEGWGVIPPGFCLPWGFSADGGPPPGGSGWEEVEGLGDVGGP